MIGLTYLAFKFNAQHLPTPDDLIYASTDKDSIFQVLRNHAANFGLILTTSSHPKFSHEFRRSDNSIDSYIYIKEVQVL